MEFVFEVGVGDMVFCRGGGAVLILEGLNGVAVNAEGPLPSEIGSSEGEVGVASARLNTCLIISTIASSLTVAVVGLCLPLSSLPRAHSRAVAMRIAVSSESRRPSWIDRGWRRLMRAVYAGMSSRLSTSYI